MSETLLTVDGLLRRSLDQQMEWRLSKHTTEQTHLTVEVCFYNVNRVWILHENNVKASLCQVIVDLRKQF